jgi:thiol-disulfide isomerase/thioredoxin
MKSLLLTASLLAIVGSSCFQSEPLAKVAVPTSLSAKGVGKRVSGLTGVDLSGNKVTAPGTGAKATVVALSSVTCPLCQKFGPTLAALEDSYSKKGVKFVFVNPSTTESGGEMSQLVKQLGLNGPYVHDPKGTWTQKLGAKTTTETFVLDQDGNVL